MKITQRNFTRCAKLATKKAVSFLSIRGFVGESARAWSMADSWNRHAEEMLGQANWEAIGKASALTVTRQLATALKIEILKAEVGSRK